MLYNNNNNDSTSFYSSSVSTEPAPDCSNSFASLDNLFDLLIDPNLLLECQGNQSKLQQPQASLERPAPSFSNESKIFVSSIGTGNSKGRPRKQDPPSALVTDPVAKKSVARREQNRVAAERCRQKKLDLISSLQLECEALRRERDNLQAELIRLKQQPSQPS
jgi:hypothetical protein